MSGRTRDASLVGLLIELEEPLSFLAHEVGVEVTLPAGATLTLEADIVRRSVSETGGVLLALRIVEDARARARRRQAGGHAPREPGRRYRPSRAKPRAKRPVEQVREELHALGERVLEIALLEPGAPPSEAIAAWVGRLAEEIGEEVPSPPPDNRRLLRQIAALHGLAGAKSER